MPQKRPHLKQARKSAGLTQEELAHRLRVDVSTVRRWEGGLTTPSAWMWPRLAKLIGVTRAELASYFEAEPSVAAQEEVTETRRQHSSQDERMLDAGTWKEDDVHRRALLGVVGGTIMGGFLPTRLVRRGVEEALVHPLTDRDVSEWDLVAHQYAQVAGRVPAHEILPDLLTELDDVRYHVESAHERQRSRLIRVAAQLSALAAISLVIAGDWREADRYWRTAQRAARSSGDHELSSLISGRRAVYALYGPASTSALGHADHALSVDAKKPTAGTACALAARAQCLALHGDHSQACRTLRELEATFDRLDDTVRSDIQTEWGWSEMRLRHVQSFVHSYAGNVSQASRAHDAALALYSRPTSLGATQVKLHQAICMVVSGDPSQGARYAADLYGSLAPELRNGHMRTSTAWVLDALPAEARNLPAARQVRELMSISGAST